MRSQDCESIAGGVEVNDSWKYIKTDSRTGCK